MKLTITYIVFNAKKNGGNSVVAEHVRLLRKRGHKASLLVLFGKITDNDDFLEIPCYFGIKGFFAVPRDIVIATFWPTAFLVTILPCKQKMHFIQGWEEDFYKHPFLKFLVHQALHLPLIKITLSDFLKKRLQKYTARKIFAISGNAVAKEFIVKKRPYRKRQKSVVILSVVSWYYEAKGTDKLEEACKKLKRIHPSYTFILVSRETKPLKNIDLFVSQPKQRELARLYKEADFLLCTSTSEGFFLPGLEAMTAGCILITTDNGGIKQYATHNKNAIIFDNISSLWKRDIIENIFKNPKKMKGLQEASFKTAKKYSWSRIVTELENIYSGISE